LGNHSDRKDDSRCEAFIVAVAAFSTARVLPHHLSASVGFFPKDAQVYLLWSWQKVIQKIKYNKIKGQGGELCAELLLHLVGRSHRQCDTLKQPMCCRLSGECA